MIPIWHVSSSVSALPTLHRIDIGPSTRLGWLLAASHGLALVAASLSWLPWVARAGIGCLILASAVHTLRSQAWRSSRQAVVSAERGSDGMWRLIFRDGSRGDPTHLRWAYVQTWGVILGFRRRSLLIMEDAVGDEALRRLTVALRLDPPGNRASSEPRS